VDALKSFADFKIGEMKFPDAKIGEIVTQAEHWAADKVKETITPQAQPSSPSKAPPKIPMPPPLRPKLSFRKGPK
jgi:hypothetical protein